MLSLPDAVSEALYFITMEALNNILRHANSNATTVSLHSDGAALILEVVDNGSGFDLDSARDSGGMGLGNMRERAARIGGDLIIESALDPGTRVKVTVPVTWADASTPGPTENSE